MTSISPHATAKPMRATHIDLAPQHLQIVQALVRQYLPNAEVFAFGSRVNGRARKYSDLDLAISSIEPLTFRTLRQLKNAFEDSDLPICIDLVDWSRADDQFRQAVETAGIAVVQ